ncbi:unnamed protein product [Cylindrotheca closterium]|uniref:J domain-containing protein n=1 Tax=Cylindrotheca closterium TaxID=2856 RepID=A0AAD2CK19_9STRA|nr:unnamed protein product [Cylindrotheca closterium]
MRSSIVAARIFQRCEKRFPLQLGITQSQHCSMQQRNIVSTPNAAKTLLGINQDVKPTVKELRHAYFEMAKKCHPDVQEQSGEDGDAVVDFLELTEAYEYLLHNKNHHRQDGNIVISLDEEEAYRQACVAVLGIPAEIVEESKQNPMFRHWLGGNTDGAQHWRSFLSVHGGLAQRLRPPAGYIEGGENGGAPASRRRRKR